MSKFACVSITALLSAGLLVSPVCAEEAPTKPMTIYSNFNIADKAHLFSCCSGFPLTTPDSFNHQRYSFAMPFTPAANATLVCSDQTRTVESVRR